MNFSAKTQLVGDAGGAGAVTRGGSQQAAPASFTVGAVGFGLHWANAEDAMAASIIRLECQKDELNAEVALLREQARILQRERDGYALHLNQVCAELGMGEGYIAVDAAVLARAKIDKWRECAKALADAVDYYDPALRDVEDGFSAECAAIARFDELEAGG